VSSGAIVRISAASTASTLRWKTVRDAARLGRHAACGGPPRRARLSTRALRQDFLGERFDPAADLVPGLTEAGELLLSRPAAGRRIRRRPVEVARAEPTGRTSAQSVTAVSTVAGSIVPTFFEVWPEASIPTSARASTASGFTPAASEPAL
jgi:hypothetical protein